MDEIWSAKVRCSLFTKYEAKVSSGVSGVKWGVVDFGKLFTETSEQKLSLRGVKPILWEPAQPLILVAQRFFVIRVFLFIML